jgi:transcriptional regulator with XRE-family HTH domain
MTIIFLTPNEVSEQISVRIKQKRLTLNLTQKTVAERSSVSLGTLKKFERTGQIALISLLKIALVLGVLDQFAELLTKENQPLPSSIDKLLEEKPTRKRGRK